MRELRFALISLCLVACGDAKFAGGSVDGARIFKEACARCHGAEGVPTAGMAARTGVKALNSAHVEALSDEEIAQQIRAGSKNKLMPAFQGALSDAQIDALVLHLRSFAPTASAPPIP